MAGSEHLLVPGGDWVLKADFINLGPDLMLLGPGGESVLIPNYLSAASPPNLVTDFGAMISADLATSWPVRQIPANMPRPTRPVRQNPSGASKP